MPDEFLTGYPLCGIGVRIRAVRTFFIVREDAVPRMALFGVYPSIPPRRGDVSRGAFQGRPAPQTHPGITPPSVSGVGAPVACRKHKKMAARKTDGQMRSLTATTALKGPHFSVIATSLGRTADAPDFGFFYPPAR